ncbi:unnamed protein product [Allacma fusca]|uniref:Poly [ADP-ribose] polymerase n=1 Tax=Allacma fusca TaxID=39272 RepID=A0A8J2KRX2_9HEXA|nr:unnamed protein product [Allacma fusca]
MILQNVHNTGKEQYSGKPTVLNIFRVERQGEADAMRESGIGNRWLLWHGTRSVNLLSILSSGLQVTPIGTELNGSLFGKGIYFADMFTKSSHYTGEGQRQYLLLCEVALGNIHSVNTHNMNEKMAKLPQGFHSLKTADSRYEPNTGATILWQNRFVPLGERTDQILEKNRYHALDYNEYIVFNSQQVSIKYLVEFTTKSKINQDNDSVRDSDSNSDDSDDGSDS